jgi:truncated hemoglobin YjbI
VTGDTLYDCLGGREGIRIVVDEFYYRLLADDDLGPFFADADMEKLRRAQTDHLREAAGGPGTYDAEPVGGSHPPSVQVPHPANEPRSDSTADALPSLIASRAASKPSSSDPASPPA